VGITGESGAAPGVVACTPRLWARLHGPSAENPLAQTMYASCQPAVEINP